jgi:hypothetical protein
VKTAKLIAERTHSIKVTNTDKGYALWVKSIGNHNGAHLTAFKTRARVMSIQMAHTKADYLRTIVEKNQLVEVVRVVDL